MLASAAFIASIVSVVLAYPSPDTIGSDLTFLFQNDLNWPLAPDHNGTILINNRSNAEAVAACAQLSEGLLETNGTYFEEDITNILQYLALETFDGQQQYWVASTSSSECQAVSLLGGIQSVSCSQELPVFCSQSAPWTLSGETDLDSSYYVQVNSSELQVLGTRDHLSWRFLGIPYANYPYERFTYSTLYNGTGEINALEFGSPCVQYGSTSSEDCLFLNIFTPYLPSSSSSSYKLKPVMLFIHGGAFAGGAGSDSIYDGGNLASRGDVVIVTINYRLSTLGFLALDDGVTNGNYGIGDMIVALEWVQAHIASFGGDPARVTIFGQSAGATAVRALLASPRAEGLFGGVIAESNLGGYSVARPYTEWMSIPEEVTKAADPLIDAVGCSGSADVLTCLRALPAEDLVPFTFAPSYVVQDGTIIQSRSLPLNGTQQNVSVIFGWVRDDAASLILAYPSENETEADAIETAVELSANLTQKILDSGLFPVPISSNQTLNIFNVTSRIGTDGFIRCIDQASVYAAAQNGKFNALWNYQFDRTKYGSEAFPGTCDPPPSPGYPYGDPNLPYFRCHAGELLYVFGNFGQYEFPFRDANDLYFSQTSLDQWSSFGRTFNPNPSTLYLAARGYTNSTENLELYGTWEEVTSGSQTPLRLLDVPSSQVAFQESEQCDLLNIPLTYFT